MHWIPAIVKDNFETLGLQSAAGSLSLQGFVSKRDAFQVTRIKAAGAIVLAKSNMAEFAFSPYETVSSILPGYTKNPYALDRVTAGSAQIWSVGAVGMGGSLPGGFSPPAGASGLYISYRDATPYTVTSIRPEVNWLSDTVEDVDPGYPTSPELPGIEPGIGEELPGPPKPRLSGPGVASGEPNP